MLSTKGWRLQIWVLGKAGRNHLCLGWGYQLGLIQWFRGPEPRGPPGPSAPLCSPSPTVLGPPTGSGDSGVTALPPWPCPRKGSYQHMALTATSQGLLCLGSTLSAQPPGQSLVHPGHQLHPLGRGGGGGLHEQFCDGSLCTACPVPVTVFSRKRWGGGRREEAQGISSRWWAEGTASPAMHGPFSSFA